MKKGRILLGLIALLLLILVAAWIVVEFAHQFWGFYLGLVGAAVGYIGARLYLEKEKGGTKKTKK